MILLIKDALLQLIRFTGNIFRRKCYRCNKGLTNRPSNTRYEDTFRFTGNLIDKKTLSKDVKVNRSNARTCI